ncbi:MAG: S-layer homology domain-containing protein [Lawsonibacter sp.]|nr:S-layer homology domain-containing protein [Lawsonibacter sp.]
MRKKSLSWLLTISMVLSMLASGPISAAALEPESGVCKIEETDYATLADALNQVTSGQTITLLGDIEHHSNIWVGTTSGYGPSFILDLNDYTLTVSNTEVPLAALDGCSLSVVDDSGGGGGVLQLVAAAGESAPTGISAVGAGSRVSVAADVTASITAAGSNSRGIYVGNGGAVEIGTGTVTGELYGVFADSNGSAAIHGNVTGNATFSSAGVYVQNNATVTVTGTVTGAYYGAISAYGGLADIKGNVTADTNGLTVEYGGLAEVEGEIRGSTALYVRNGVGWDAPHVSIVGDVTSTGTTAMNVIEAADIEVTGTITGCIDVSGGISTMPEITVNGNVAVSGGYGISVYYGGTITINGAVTGASPYLYLNQTNVSKNEGVRSGDYDVYSNFLDDEYDRVNTVRILVLEPPTAEGVTIVGTPTVGGTLTGDYMFQSGGTAEGETSFQWLRVSSKTSLLGQPYLLYTTNNTSGVTSNPGGPTFPATFTVAGTTHIAKISDYHYATSDTPGTIALQKADGTIYGPWSAVESGYWCVYPDIELPAGTYTVIDSKPGSWSFNYESGYAGMLEIVGYTKIIGATGQTYSLQNNDIGYSVLFEVTPRDVLGTEGARGLSSPFGPTSASFWTDGITSTGQYPFGGGDGSIQTQAIEISTAEQLAQFAYNVNAGNSYANQYIKLAVNLNLDQKQWVPIGKASTAVFAGSFDGGGHSISGMTMTASSGSDCYGLFGNLSAGGTIEHLTIESGSIQFFESVGYGYFGGIVGHSLGLVKDCVNKADLCIVNNEWTYAGGIVGLGDADTWSYTWSARISGCRNEGDIQIGRIGSVGGIIGSQMNGTAQTYVDQCENLGSVTGGRNAEVGGIAGRVGNASVIGVANCFNKGMVSAGAPDSNSACAGGILGYQYYTRVQNCYNTGRVTLIYGAFGNTFAGGIVGYSLNSIVNCYNTGLVTGTGVAGEGICGSMYSCGNCYVLDTAATAEAVAGVTVLTDDQMKGLADASITFSTADDPGSSGPATGAFLYALGHGRESDPTYPMPLLNWSSDDHNFNGGYPVFCDTEELYVISFGSNGGTPAAARTVAAGKTIAEAPVTTKDGSSFNGWYSAASGGSQMAFPYTPSDDVILYAQWGIASTGSPGGGSGPSYTVTTETAGTSTTNRTAVTPRSSAGISSVSLPAGLMDALLDETLKTGGTGKRDVLEIAVNTPSGTVGLNATLPRSALEEIASKTNAGLRLASPFFAVSFDGKALETISGSASGASIVITAGIVDTRVLSQEDRTKTKDRPVYDFSVFNGNVQVSEFGGGCATVTIPYTLQPDENPNCVVIYYLADDGTLKTVRGHYSAAAKTVVFKTAHFSSFVIGYHLVEFQDVEADAWYRPAVDFLAARGITSGTEAGLFGPELGLTRGQFVVFLLNAYGIRPERKAEFDPGSQFEDAGTAYYTDYLLVAKGLGIVTGIGNNTFAPERTITRQEMVVMMVQALTVMDEIPESNVDRALSDFSDENDVADWAQEAFRVLVRGGMISGTDGRLAPKEAATRAQMAQVLVQLLSR